MAPERAVHTAITHWHLSRPNRELAENDLTIALRGNKVFAGVYRVDKLDNNDRLCIDAILIGENDA